MVIFRHSDNRLPSMALDCILGFVTGASMHHYSGQSLARMTGELNRYVFSCNVRRNAVALGKKGYFLE